MAFIVVPLTTVTMDPVPNSEMGNATCLFQLMRNRGAGAGISTAAITAARRSQFRMADSIRPAGFEPIPRTPHGCHATATVPQRRRG